MIESSVGVGNSVVLNSNKSLVDILRANKLIQYRICKNVKNDISKMLTQHTKSPALHGICFILSSTSLSSTGRMGEKSPTQGGGLFVLLSSAAPEL